MTRLLRWRPAPRLVDAVLVIGAIIAISWIFLSAFVFQPSPGWGYDFEAYLVAADRLARGTSAYLAWTLAGPFRPGPYGLYLYAPPLAVALVPMSLLSVPSATFGWFLLRGALLVAAVLLMPLRVRTRCLVLMAAAISEPALVDMNLGNVSIVALFLSAVAWRFLDRPLGGAATALAITVRPTFAIYLVWWAVRRRWRALAACLATGIVIILLTLPVVGVDAYRDYLTLLRNLSDVTGVPNNMDLGSSLARLGVPGPLPTVALLAGYAVAIAAVAISLRRGAETSFLVTLGATLLLSPLLWDHYLVLVLPCVGFLLERRPWAGVLLGLVLLFWMPAWLAPFMALAATLGPFLARPRAAAEPYAAASSTLSLSPT